MNRERYSQLQKELDRIVPLVVREYNPDKILVFGSFADKSVGEWSDLDLVIIKETAVRFYDRLAQVFNIVRPRVGMDVLVYTAQEWKKIAQESAFVSREIAGKAQVVYAA